MLFPQLTPVALSALIIIGHMSMKMFDLIMSVSGAQWLTEVPAVYVWQTLLTSDYAKAAAISVFLLRASSRSSSCPYLIYINRAESAHDHRPPRTPALPRRRSTGAAARAARAGPGTRRGRRPHGALRAC